MMRKPELFLYRLIVWLHPAAFREEFGREMLLDFEESLTHEGAARIFFDALLSVVRQWARCAVSGGVDRTCEPQASLLAGQYAPLRDQPLNGLELSRGLFASLVLLGLCGYSLSHGASRIRSFDIVYAASQGGRIPEGGAAGQTSGSSSIASTVHRDFKEFDVATIHENRKESPSHLSFPMTNDDSYVPTHGYMQISNLPLFAYIQFAYRMDPLQASALHKQLPDWAASVRYDIEARVDGDPNKDDMRRMVRALLASRFRLQLHTETSIANVFELRLVHPGKIGPSLRAHAADDANCKNRATNEFFVPCGAIRISIRDAKNRAIRMTGRKIVLDQLASYAGTQIGRPVLNKTELNGRYDFTLDYSAPVPTQVDSDTEASGAIAPLFQDAIQERLGLKLVPGKGPVTTYVLDHVERPSEN